MPLKKVNGLTMYYEIHGEGESIVFIPGFSHDHTAWAGIARLLEQDYQVILLDNRGTGQTDVPVGPYTIETMAADIAGLCVQLGIQQAHFVASSMGGFILQVLAHQYPSLVKSGVISNSVLNANCVFKVYVEGQLELLKGNAPLSALVHASLAWAFSYRFLSLPGMVNQLITTTVQNPYPFTIAGYEGQCAALTAFDSTSWVGGIKIPMLIFAGDQDLIFNPTSVKTLADKIPNAEYYCYEECGHLPFLEYPDEFAEKVRKFVSF